MKRTVRMLSLLCAVVMLLALCGVAAYAAETDHDHIKGQAVVSEEVSRADGNNSDGTSTEFFLFIENPIEIGEIPDMGTTGINLQTLILSAMAAGAVTLVLLLNRHEKKE